MQIKRAHIIAFLALAIALGGVGAVYQFYVKERLRELAEHEAEKKQLETRIAQLREQFSDTKPGVMVNIWQTAAQPWSETVLQRSLLFQPGVEIARSQPIPENTIPRFYYAEVYPEKVEALEKERLKKNTIFTANFGVDTPADISGRNPSRQEVQGWLRQMDAYTAAAKLLIDANAIEIKRINMWPPRQGPSGRLGHVEYRTIGYEFTMGVREFMMFLDDLRLRRQYFNVDGFWIYNETLRYPNVPLNVQMLITHAQFVEREQGAAPPGAPAAIDATNAMSGFTGGGLSGLRAMGGGGANPFGGSVQNQPKPSIMRRILNLFPF